MIKPNIKADLHSIAEHIAADASYTDAMYELYVRMKIAKGKEAANKGHVTLHKDVKRKFSK